MKRQKDKAATLAQLLEKELPTGTGLRIDFGNFSTDKVLEVWNEGNHG